MFKSGGLFLPKGEKHFARYGHRISTYQKADRVAAYAYVRRWRRALDVGANVGIFSCDFATKFEEVVAFEPIPQTRECLAANVPQNVRIESYAIADEVGMLSMYRTGSSGGSFICDHPLIAVPETPLKPGRTIPVEVRTIDGFAFDAVDLIKLDVQGAEYAALVGARETILRYRPVIMVEEKAFSSAHAAFIQKTTDLLVSYGMRPREKAQADRVFTFDD